MRGQDAAIIRSPEVQHSEAQAAAVVGVWLECGPGIDLSKAINSAIQQDRGIAPLIAGLVNLNAYLLSMLAMSIGTSSEALLGAFTSDVRYETKGPDEGRAPTS